MCYIYAMCKPEEGEMAPVHGEIRKKEPRPLWKNGSTSTAKAQSAALNFSGTLSNKALQISGKT